MEQRNPKSSVMRHMLPLLGLSFFILHSSFLQAQTTIPAGPVTGTWKKTGSPYKITGQIYVPKDSTLRIEPGVKVEFQGAYMLHVYGSIQAIGKIADSVVFTAANKSTGWQGFHVHGSSNPKDSFILDYFRMEYVNFSNLTLNSHGAIYFDTSFKARLSHGIFYKNRSNVGGCIRLRGSKLNLNDIDFMNNEARDDGATAITASGSGISSSYSVINGVRLRFLKNKCSLPNNHVQDSINAYSWATIYLGNGTYTFKDILLEENSASGPSGIFTLGYDVYLTLTNVDFIRNKSISCPAFLYESEYGKQDYENINFIENRRSWLSGNSGTPASAYQDAKYSAPPSFKGITLMNQDGEFAISTRHGTFNHLVGMGSDSGLFLRSDGDVAIMNSLMVNNGIAIVTLGFGTTFIANSIIAYNGLDNHAGESTKGGIYMTESGAKYNLFNNIIQCNRLNGKYYNIIGDRGAKVLPFYRNNIVEGGLDSARYIFGAGTITATSSSGNMDDTVSFIKPPKGIGPTFFDTGCDFHYRNTCSYTYPGWNSSLTTFSDGVTYVDHAHAGEKDLDGNPRLRCGIADIGPYELAGSKQSLSIDKEPVDQLICAGAMATVSSIACGASVNYQWQKSSDGNNFTNVAGANAADYSFAAQDSAWYRLIIHQAECNKRDTTVFAKITLKPSPKPNLGADTALGNSGNKVLNPGTFTNYQWNLPKANPATSSSLTVDKTNLDTGKNMVWVEVTGANGCKGRDTVIITLEPAIGLDNPALVGIKIYPIPAESYLHIELPDGIHQGSYSIISLNGVNIQKGIIDMQNSAIDLSKISSGTYVLEIAVDGKRYGVRMVK